VAVIAPTITTYAITVNLVIYTSADQTDVVDRVTAALQAYADGKVARLGQDVTQGQILAAALLPGEVYSVAVASPSADVPIANTAAAKCTGITVNVTGTTNG